MTGSGREPGFTNWFNIARRPTNPRSNNNHNTSNDYTSPRTSGSHHDHWWRTQRQQDSATEQPDRQRRMSPVKSLFGFSSTGERRSAANRSHITPSPEQDAATSHPNSPPRRPLSWMYRGTRDFTAGVEPSQSEVQSILELGDLIKLQTASPVYTLQRLAALEALLRLNDVNRTHLIETAKLAVQVARREFNRASRQRASRAGGASDPAPMIQFADATDLETYGDTAKSLTEELATRLSNFGVFEGASLHYMHAAEGLKTVVESVARGGAEAEMMEIRWIVERKCSYLDAVAMMDARIGEAGRVGVVAQRPRRHSG